MKNLKRKITATLMFIKYSLMPTNMLLRATNHDDFSLLEQGVIGKVLLNRFETQEDLEIKCEEVLG